MVELIQSFWKKLFAKKSAARPDSQCDSGATQASEAAAHWEKAIAAAEAGDNAAAVKAFKCAIKLNSDYYISVIKPEPCRAEICWKRAVDEYTKEKEAKVQDSSTPENHCAICGKDLGTQWHYFFESLSLGDTIGTQCPDCNRTVCKEHMGPASDGKNPRSPCAKCGGKVLELQEGPASSSMVETAQSERRYRGGIKHPSAFGRTVIRG